LARETHPAKLNPVDANNTVRQKMKSIVPDWMAKGFANTQESAEALRILFDEALPTLPVLTREAVTEKSRTYGKGPSLEAGTREHMKHLLQRYLEQLARDPLGRGFKYFNVILEKDWVELQAVFEPFITPLPVFRMGDGYAAPRTGDFPVAETPVSSPQPVSVIPPEDTRASLGAAAMSAGTPMERNFQRWNFDAVQELDRLCRSLPILSRERAMAFFQEAQMVTSTHSEPVERTMGRIFESMMGFVSASDRKDFSATWGFTSDSCAEGFLMVESHDDTIGTLFCVARVSENSFLTSGYLGAKNKEAVKELRAKALPSHTFAIDWQTQTPGTSLSINHVQLVVTDVEGMSLGALQAVMAKRRSREKPLVVVSPGLHASALNLVSNGDVVALRATPLPRQSLEDLLEDLAVFTGATFLSKDWGFDSLPFSDFGAKRLAVESPSGALLPGISWADVAERDLGQIALLQIDSQGCSFCCKPSPQLAARIANLMRNVAADDLDGVRMRLHRLGCPLSEVNATVPVPPPRPDSSVIRVPVGYASRYFVTEFEKSEAVLEQPRVLLSAASVDNLDDLMPILEYASRHSLALLAVAPEFGQKALAAMVTNNVRGRVSCLAIALGSSLSAVDSTLAELAAATGAKILGMANEAWPTGNNVADVLGTAARVSAGRSSFAVWAGSGPGLGRGLGRGQA
jgi:hypothetical protein